MFVIIVVFLGVFYAIQSRSFKRLFTVQLKTVTESEVDRLLKPRATLSYCGSLEPVGTTEQWMFGANTITTMLPNCASSNTDVQPHFHTTDTANDLTRPF